MDVVNQDERTLTVTHEVTWTSYAFSAGIAVAAVYMSWAIRTVPWFAALQVRGRRMCNIAALDLHGLTQL